MWSQHEYVQSAFGSAWMWLPPKNENPRSVQSSQTFLLLASDGLKYLKSKFRSAPHCQEATPTRSCRPRLSGFLHLVVSFSLKSQCHDQLHQRSPGKPFLDVSGCPNCGHPSHHQPPCSTHFYSQQPLEPTIPRLGSCCSPRRSWMPPWHMHVG